MSFDRILIARILFTLMTAGGRCLQWSLISTRPMPQIRNGRRTRDFMWCGRSQVMSDWGFLAFALIWWPGPLAVERLYFVAAMGAVVYAAFFRGADSDADLRRRRLRQKRLPAIQRAYPDLREKVWTPISPLSQFSL